jgi:hypothetical protein
MTLVPEDIPITWTQRWKLFTDYLVCTLFSVPWLAWLHVLWFLFAYKRRLIDLAAPAKWILKSFAGQPQIALSFAGEQEDTASSFGEEVYLLFAGPMETDDDILAWVKGRDSRPESVSHVSVLSQFGGIWVHRIIEVLEEELPLEVPTDSDCKISETVNAAEDVCKKPVLLLTWISPEVNDSDLVSPAPAVGELGESTETDGRPPSPPVKTRKGRKNRPSAKTRRRHAERARAEKELEKTLSESPIEAPSPATASLLAPESSTPLSALAPAFIPSPLVGEQQSGPLASTPVSASSDT